MSQPLSLIALFASVVLTAACGSESAAGGAVGAAGSTGAGGGAGGAAGTSGAAGGPGGGTAGAPAHSATSRDAGAFFARCPGETLGTDAGISSDSGGGVQTTPPGCVMGGGGCFLAAHEPSSFVQGASLGLGGASTGILRYAPGTPGSFCASGRADAGAGPKGWVAIFVRFDTGAGGAGVPFDLAAHSITKYRFRVVQDTPVTGIQLAAMAYRSADCQDLAGCHIPANGPAQFDWNHQAAVCPGSMTVSFADLTPREDAPLDPTRLFGLSFYIDTPPDTPHFAFDYSFCIEDLAFLNADDQPVTP